MLEMFSEHIIRCMLELSKFCLSVCYAGDLVQYIKLCCPLRDDRVMSLVFEAKFHSSEFRDSLCKFSIKLDCSD